jgi:hypothetical protein
LSNSRNSIRLTLFSKPVRSGLIFGEPAVRFHLVVEDGQCLDRQSAESLLHLRADTEMQGRIEELADKCTEGRLTPEERDEYEAMIRVGNFVAILQAKARRLLAEGHAA